MKQVNVGSVCWSIVVGGWHRLATGMIRRLGGVPIGDLQRAQADLADARTRIAELEAQATKAKKATPDFVKANRPKKAEGEPRKKRTVNFARKREAPTRIIDHAYDQCPICGTTLLGGSVKWSRQVVHVPIVPVEVIEHRF